jgi:hypothetical protein
MNEPTFFSWTIIIGLVGSVVVAMQTVGITSSDEARLKAARNLHLTTLLLIITSAIYLVMGT